MNTNLLEPVIRSIAPQLIDRALGSLSCFRTYIVPVPVTSDSDRLKMYLRNLTNENPTWTYWEEHRGIPTNIRLENQSGIQSSTDPRDWTLIFSNNYRGKLLLNWPQTITISYAHRAEDYVIIHSEFNRAQIVERGLLTNNCEAVLKNLYAYFQINNIDLLPYIQKTVRLQDKMSVHEKPLNAWQILFGLFVVLPIVLYLLVWVVDNFT